MSDTVVDVGEARERLEALLDLVRQGREVLISDGAEVVARLGPPARDDRTPGLSRGAIRASEDFDDPLPASFWMGEE